MHHSPSLEQLKKQARDLLRAYRGGDPLARKRFALHLPHFSAREHGSRTLLLADALFVVARENGFPSWPKLKAHLDAGQTVPAGQSGRRWRRQLVLRLAQQAGHLVRQRDVEGLVACLSGLPLRTFLQLRSLLIERNAYPPVVETLILGLSHPNPSVRYECAQAMDHFADDRCVEPLRRLLDDPVPRVRRMALHALSCDACKLTPLHVNLDFVALAIEQATSDPSITVRRHAVSELSLRCSDPRAVQTFRELLDSETDPAVRRYARRGLDRVAPDSVQEQAAR